MINHIEFDQIKFFFVGVFKYPSFYSHITVEITNQEICCVNEHFGYIIKIIVLKMENIFEILSFKNS